MKLNKFTLSLALLLTLCVGAGAQSITNAETATTSPPTYAQLGGTFASWLLTVNTNYSYATVLLWDAPVYQENINIANETGFSLDLWRQNIAPFQNIFESIEGRFRQAGIAGVFASDGFGPEVGYMYGSLRVGAYFNYVYNENPVALGEHVRNNFEYGAFADQMMNSSTAAGFFISRQSHGPKLPVIGINVTVTFGTQTGLASELQSLF
jgi:hypothetical protein